MIFTNKFKKIIVMHILFFFSFLLSFLGGMFIKKHEQENKREKVCYCKNIENSKKINILYSLKIDSIEDEEEKDIEESSTNFVKKDGEVADSYINMANNYFEKLPENIKTKLLENGWNIYITDENLAEKYYANTYEKIAGVTVYDEKNIYIEARSGAIKNSIYHEVGHAIDSEHGFTSQNEDFNEIYENEQENFVEVGNEESNYGTSSNLEYFAETFNQIMLYPESAKENVPESYEYIENLVNEF